MACRSSGGGLKDAQSRHRGLSTTRCAISAERDSLSDVEVGLGGGGWGRGCGGGGPRGGASAHRAMRCAVEPGASCRAAGTRRLYMWRVGVRRSMGERAVIGGDDARAVRGLRRSSGVSMAFDQVCADLRGGWRRGRWVSTGTRVYVSISTGMAGCPVRCAIGFRRGSGVADERADERASGGAGCIWGF
jgi:hypothetical protein